MSVLPPVFVELKANAGEFMAAMGEVNAKLDQLGAKGESVGTRLKEGLGKGMMAGGAAATAAGAVLLEMGEKIEKSHKDLEVAINNTGASYDEFGKKVSQAVSHQEKFGHTSGDTQEALAVLTRATGDAGKAFEDMDLVTQIAAVHHSSLAEAAELVAKMHAGSTRALKEFGINAKEAGAGAKELAKDQKQVEVDTGNLNVAQKKLADLLDIQHHKSKLTEADHIALRDAQTKVTEATSRLKNDTTALNIAQQQNNVTMDFATEKSMVLQKIHGTAEAQASTFGGKIAALKARLEDMAGTIGQKVGPALTMAGPLLMGLGAIIQSGVVPALFEMAVAAFAASWEIVLIVGAVAAAAAGIYFLVTHWSEVWDKIKEITAAAWEWIKDRFDGLVDWFKKLPGRAIDAIKEFGPKLVEWYVDAWKLLIDKVEQLVVAYLEFWAKVPGRIIDAIKEFGPKLLGWYVDAWKLLLDKSLDFVVDYIVFWEKMPGRIIDAIKEFGPKLVGWYIDAWKLLTDKSEDLAVDYVMFWVKLPGRLLDAVKEFGPKLAGWGKDAMTSARDAIHDYFFKTLIPFMSDLPGKIVEALGDGAKLLFQWGKDLVQGIVDGIKAAASRVGDALSDVLSNLPGAGLLSNVPGIGDYFKHKAEGGPVNAMQPYIVGERGPELFVPRSAGTIVPNNQLGGGGGVTMNWVYNVTVAGDVSQQSRDEIRRMFAEHDTELVRTLSAMSPV